MTRWTDQAAAQVDSYLEELLASRAEYLRARDGGSSELAHAAAAMRHVLVRFHPSFRFEERLAARLRSAADDAARPLGVARGTIVALPVPGAAPGSDQRPDAEPRAPSTSLEHGWMLLGGAVASGVSLAAGVLLARRRSRHLPRWGRPA